MTINADTRIAPILKHHPEALNAIISISPRFEKLRNPIMRRLMAGRTSLAMASKVGGCKVEDFFVKLKQLGFNIDNTAVANQQQEKILPAFLKSLKKEDVIDFDVRPILASGTDPLQHIMEKVKSVKAGQALKIINTFEPTPLILLLQKKGFETYTDEHAADHFETYFFKSAEQQEANAIDETVVTEGWDEYLEKYKGNLQEVDVRHLEMPQPMMAILSALDTLPNNKALYVYHKRIPVFLLPELNDRNFDYRVKEISDGEVHMLIFKQ